MPAAGRGGCPRAPSPPASQGWWQREVFLASDQPRAVSASQIGSKTWESRFCTGISPTGAVPPTGHRWEGIHAATPAPSPACSRNHAQKVLFFAKSCVMPGNTPCQGISPKPYSPGQEKKSVSLGCLENSLHFPNSQCDHGLNAPKKTNK